jgi:hypothetical protein
VVVLCRCSGGGGGSVVGDWCRWEVEAHHDPRPVLVGCAVPAGATLDSATPVTGGGKGGARQSDDGGFSLQRLEP